MYSNQVSITNDKSKSLFRSLASLIAPALIVLSLFLGGCAATVTRDTPDSALRAPVDDQKRIVLNIQGDKEAINPNDWGDFKNEWRDSMKEAADASGYSFAYEDGEGKADGNPGTLILVYVNDYRYLSVGLRLLFGVMTGNAFVDARASFLDSKSGDRLGERSYKTTSSAWQGIAAPMTRKQLDAICREMIVDAGGRPAK